MRDERCQSRQLHGGCLPCDLVSDRDSADAAIDRLLRRIPRAVRSLVRGASFDDAYTAACDALLDYLDRPQQFDPSRGLTLEQFLKLAAMRNVINLLKSDRRRRERETEYVQRSLAGHRLSTPERVDALRSKLLALLAPMPVEAATLELWLDGERNTRVLATSLGVGELPYPDQRAEVKRFKDRINKRARRHGASIG